MLQILLCEPGKFVQSRPPQPPRREGEALVRIRRIGVCGTDLPAFRGRQPFFSYPRVLGHELAGEVVEIEPDERGIRPGDRVAIEPYVHCGLCRACRAGRTNCCSSLQVLGVHCDGGMQEWVSVPVDLLHPGGDLTLDQLALVETLGIGFHAVERAALLPDEWAVVVGAGPIGLTVMQFARIAGARVVAVDVNEARLEFTRRLGVEYQTLAGDEALGGLEELIGPDLADCVFDATGSLDSMSGTLRYAGPGGRVVMVGLAQGTFQVDDPLFHRRELSLHATRNSAGAFPAVIDLIRSGDIDTSPWITHRMPLERVPEEFERLYSSDTLLVKAMIES